MHQYFTRVRLGRFMCELFVSWLKIISLHPSKKKKHWKLLLKNGPLVELCVVPNLKCPRNSNPVCWCTLVSQEMPGVPGKPRVGSTWGLFGRHRSSDKLALTLTSSNVYSSLSMELSVSLHPEGTKSFVKTAGGPICQALNHREWVSSCQEHLETPLMSSGRWRH